MRKLECWNVDKLIEAAKQDSAIEVNMGGRILQFTEPYRESLRSGRWPNEKAMIKHREEWIQHNGFSIFNTKGKWHVSDVTDCRTEPRVKGEGIDAFLLRTVKTVAREVDSLEEAIEKAVEYRQHRE